MQIESVSGLSPIAVDPEASAALYRDGLSLPLEVEGGYLSTDALPGVKHFGLWPLRAPAKACFGTEQWPADVPVPQATIEFEMKDKPAVAAGVQELRAKGFEILHPPKEEPWGQTVARLLSPEGLLIGLSFAPRFH